MSTDSANWRPDTDATTYFLHEKKKAAVADRRPVIRRASDLVGPGVGATAKRITNFNDTLATYNGFFSAAEGALNAPSASGAFVGYVSSDEELGGVQIMTSLSTGTVYRRVFNRNPLDASTIYWGTWGTL